MIQGLLWEIGDARLGRRLARVPIWFARRLWDRAVQRQVAETARARPHPRQRVIITSSRATRVRDITILGAIVVPLRDVLSRPESLAVDADILDARLSGISVQSDRGPVVLSADGTRLRINGGPVIAFKSPLQIAAIRRLVAAYQAGELVPVIELTEHGNPSRLFGAKKWAELSPYLKSTNGLWGFEL